MYQIFIADGLSQLNAFVESCNDVGDEIVAVTQQGETYTIIYKLWQLEE